jgi:hypothetical protein
MESERFIAARLDPGEPEYGWRKRSLQRRVEFLGHSSPQRKARSLMNNAWRNSLVIYLAAINRYEKKGNEHQ